MPIQMHAQMSANVPFLVAEYSVNMFFPVTDAISAVMIVALIKPFHCFSFAKMRNSLPT